MLKKILLLFLLSKTFVFGDDGWWIYTYEDVSTLKAVFNYLAMIKTDSGYMGIIQTVLIAGLTFTIIFKFLDILAIPKYLLSVIGTMLIVFSINTTIMVQNVKSYDSFNPNVNNYAVVDNVPFIFAVLSSAFSSVGYNSALLIETIFSDVTSASDTTQASFLKTGNLGAWKILDALDSIDALTISNDGQDFNKNFNEYLQLCVFKIGFAIDPGLKSLIENKSDLLEYLSPTSSPNEYIQNLSSQKVINSEGNLTTCGSLYNKAYSSFSTLRASGVAYDKAHSLVSKITSNVDGAASTVSKMMTGSGLANAQANINNYILMTGVRKAFENSWQSYGIGASSAQAGFGAGLAEANLQAQGKVKAKSAATMMPSIHSVLQAVMYVLFPLVLIVQLFAGGFKILQNYILGILWLELWIPSYSVLNYFTLKEAQQQAYDKLVSSTASSGPEGMLTLANQNEIYNTIANQAAIAADMYIVGIPALAGFILFASFQALSAITSGVANVVGQYSNNQTLNQERANLAALDNVNEQMKLNNPLYTGNVGTIQAMIAQNGSLSQASIAAGKFLASGSNLNNISELAKTELSGAANSSAKQFSETGSYLNKFGNISNAMGASSNQGAKNAATVIGENSFLNQAGSMDKVEQSADMSLTDKANLGNARKESLDKAFGSSYKGSEISSYIDENTKTSTLSNKLNLSGGNQDDVVDVQSKGETKSFVQNKAEQNITEERGKDYFDTTNSLATKKQDEDITQFDTSVNQGATSIDGKLTQKGQNIIEADTGSKLEQTHKKIEQTGSVQSLIEIEGRDSAGSVAQKMGEQEIGDKRGGFEKEKYSAGQYSMQETSGKNAVMNELGGDAINTAAYVYSIKNVASAHGEINAMESMRQVGLIEKDESLYNKKLTDAGFFSAVDKDGNKVTMYTDSKGQILGYEKQTINNEANNGSGAMVKTVHDASGRVLAKIEDGSTKLDYSHAKDNSVKVDYTVANTGAAYKHLNENLHNSLENALSDKDRDKALQKYLDDIRVADLKPSDMTKTMFKNELAGDGLTNPEVLKKANDKLDNFISEYIPGGESFVQSSKDLDNFVADTDKKAKEFFRENVPFGNELVDFSEKLDKKIYELLPSSDKSNIETTSSSKNNVVTENTNEKEVFIAPPAPDVEQKK